ncbi:MAG: group II intron reverse transcriptase/maturase [Geobacteraceae bacterium]
MATKLLRIAEKARKEPGFKFTSLYHLMNEELLRECFKQLRKDAAAGIDDVTKEEYAADLDSNLSNLIDRLHRMAYKPQPVRRAYIPKPGSIKQRPLGIPCLEDKLVQAGLVRILEAVYEQDFITDSYGFRPARSCHEALRALSDSVEGKPVNHIVEVDIKGFFDNVNQEWLMKFLEHRIGDKRIQRMVKRFLKAGVYEDGSITVSDEGTPQGGVISPLLANIYLHYALDLWFEKVIRPRCIGFARMMRYTDDFVVCFQYELDAVKFRRELGSRLGKFGLEVEPTKTRVVKFGRFAVQNAKAKGERPETFDFLGLTHYCGTRRDGKGFRMKRKTARKKFTAKVKAQGMAEESQNNEDSGTLGNSQSQAERPLRLLWRNGQPARHQEIRRRSRKAPDEMAKQARQEELSHMGEVPRDAEAFSVTGTTDQGQDVPDYREMIM